MTIADWFRARFSRCWSCGRRLILHSPWRAYRCHRTPLGLTLTEEGATQETERDALTTLGDANDAG
jgi:hypothetical protein